MTPAIMSDVATGRRMNGSEMLITSPVWQMALVVICRARTAAAASSAVASSIPRVYPAGVCIGHPLLLVLQPSIRYPPKRDLLRFGRP